MPMVCSHFCQLPSHHCVYRLIRTGYGIFYGRTPAITVGTAFSNNALNLQGPETPTLIGLVGSAQTFTLNRILQPRPITGFARIEEFESSANSMYNGLTIQLNKRFSENYQFLAAYTSGKVIDDNPDATS